MQKIRLRNLALVVASTCTLCSNIYVTSASPNNLPDVNGCPIVGTNQSMFFNNKSVTSSEDHEGGWGAYVALDCCMGNDGAETWIALRGAWAQPSDPKTGDPDEFTNGNDPQGGTIIIYDYACIVLHI
ncbi:MAG: hypothetical protein RIF33_19960 [Cyclobacteriaceae bacterium]